MSHTERIEVFKAQTQNLRELNKVWKQINRSINAALRKGDSEAAAVHTKLLALTFCAWSEVNFSKLIHTPYGFDLDQIEQIKQEWNQYGVGAGWNRCLELGLRKITSQGKSNYVPNIKQNVSRSIDKYVVEPSLIRNKIAHGQWCVALNRQFTGRNQELTTAISNLDTIEVQRWYEAHRILSNIIEILIESPHRAFHRDYWTEIATLEERLQVMETWTLESKIEKLKKKKISSVQVKL